MRIPRLQVGELESVAEVHRELEAERTTGAIVQEV